MRHYTFHLAGIAAIVLHGFSAHAYLAFVSVPVANVVGQPLAPLHQGKRLDVIYDQMPLSWAGEKNNLLTCPRIRQLLFNETVNVVREVGQEALIEVANFFYVSGDQQSVTNECWTLKQYLMPYDVLIGENIPVEIIPQPCTADTMNQRDVVTLQMPYIDGGLVYSAGTRFVYTDCGHDYYRVVLFDPARGIAVYKNISSTLCIESWAKSLQERIADFVSLLKKWAHLRNGIVPFVWGGCAFTNLCYSNYFKRVSKETHDGVIVEVWKRAMSDEYPYAGFDASGLVLRAAQICGIPYFCQNSTTAARFLAPLDNSAPLREGDLLWMPGGLLVVSDLYHNRIIGACGYQTGYGKVVELALDELFESIYTYQDLVEAYQLNKPLIVKQADGSVSKTVHNYTLLQLRSVWR